MSWKWFYTDERKQLPTSPELQYKVKAHLLLLLQCKISREESSHNWWINDYECKHTQNIYKAYMQTAKQIVGSSASHGNSFHRLYLPVKPGRSTKTRPELCCTVLLNRSLSHSTLTCLTVLCFSGCTHKKKWIIIEWSPRHTQTCILPHLHMHTHPQQCRGCCVKWSRGCMLRPQKDVRIQDKE